MSDHVNTATAFLLWFTALAFIVYFACEYHWIKTAMGRSLMVMAVGVLILTSHGVAFQVFGPGYWGREWIVPVGRALVIAAFLQRIWALRRARRDDPVRSASRPRRRRSRSWRRALPA